MTYLLIILGILYVIVAYFMWMVIESGRVEQSNSSSLESLGWATIWPIALLLMINN